MYWLLKSLVCMQRCSTYNILYWLKRSSSTWCCASRCEFCGNFWFGKEWLSIIHCQYDCARRLLLPPLLLLLFLPVCWISFPPMPKWGFKFTEKYIRARIHQIIKYTNAYVFSRSLSRSSSFRYWYDSSSPIDTHVFVCTIHSTCIRIGIIMKGITPTIDLSVRYTHPCVWQIDVYVMRATCFSFSSLWASKTTTTAASTWIVILSVHFVFVWWWLFRR